MMTPNIPNVVEFRDLIFREDETYSCSLILTTNIVVFPGVVAEFDCCFIQAETIINLGELHTTRTAIMSPPIQQGYDGHAFKLLNFGLTVPDIEGILQRLHINKTIYEYVSIPGTRTNLNSTGRGQCSTHCYYQYWRNLVYQG